MAGNQSSPPDRPDNAQLPAWVDGPPTPPPKESAGRRPGRSDSLMTWADCALVEETRECEESRESEEPKKFKKSQETMVSMEYVGFIIASPGRAENMPNAPPGTCTAPSHLSAVEGQVDEAEHIAAISEKLQDAKLSHASTGVSASRANHMSAHEKDNSDISTASIPSKIPPSAVVPQKKKALNPSAPSFILAPLARQQQQPNRPRAKPLAPSFIPFPFPPWHQNPLNAFASSAAFIPTLPPPPQQQHWPTSHKFAPVIFIPAPGPIFIPAAPPPQQQWQPTKSKKNRNRRWKK